MIALKEAAMRKLALVSLTALLATTAPSLAMTGYSPADWQRADLDFHIGADLIQHGRIAEALPHLDSALDQSPDDVEILNYLGFAHRVLAASRIGTSRAAELRLSTAYYRRVLEQDLTQPAFLGYMGELYLSQDDVASARSELKALDAECPNGCAEHDHLAASLAAYVPPPPPPPAE
jgi:Flp pilus assembly protein TadD